jgi:sugar phosphate isomerase/epimerase
MRTAINLYTVRALNESTLGILRRVREAGYDGVQVSGLEDATPAAVGKRARDLGLDVAPSHVDLGRLETDLQGVVDVERTLGSGGVVVPYVSPEGFESRAAALATAERLDTLAAELTTHGLSLHYHNHAHEFAPLDESNGLETIRDALSSALATHDLPLADYDRATGSAALDGTTGFEVFADASQVGLELDVGWVRDAGEDPVALLDRYADRVEVVHLKDMAPSAGEGAFREIGAGEVDVRACAAAAADADAEWLVYEHDDPDDPAASIEAGAAYLSDLP